MKYNVEFSFNIEVKAETKEDAEFEASLVWQDIMPRLDEMNVTVEEIKD